MSISDLLHTDHEEERGSVKGVAIGVVTSNKGDAAEGMIRVRLPWREDQETYWARLAVPMAGGKRGTYFVPEVGDEVLLAFDQGDMRHPYVIGGLWNGRDAPPQSNSDGENNIRQIRSRSGHELTFDDTRFAEAVEIKTKGGHKIRLDDKRGKPKIEIVDSSGKNKIVIDSAAGTMSLESLTSISIKSKTIKIEAAATLTVKANAAATVKGNPVLIN